jgi:NAD(P)-dependent dehydrogenase (short-subunit alcohol dehydrogenase family)
MDVRNLSGKTALVTGAASGIGRETALACAARGADLAICDIDDSGLKETEQHIRDLGRSVIAARVDVASAEAMTGFAAQVHAAVPAVDLLVNNAGVAIGASFLDTPLEEWEWILGINVRGVVHGCHAFVPRMVERGIGGHVVNVASAAGFYASESLSAYSTTKFAVVGFSESLHEELARHRIGVTVICPGLINTPITRNARLHGNLGAGSQPREQMISAYQRRNYGPERVARGILSAVQRDRVVAPVTPEAWGIYYLKRFAPWLLRRISQFMGERSRRELDSLTKDETDG